MIDRPQGFEPTSGTAVWAPRASLVEVVLEGTRLPMHRTERRGWWGLDRPLGPGTRYAFSVDGGPPLPDPRGLAHPDGVHGPSAVVDPALFTRRPDWAGKDVRGGVGYELHVGTFTDGGTFDSAVERLAHLAELGVDYVEVMPVAPFPGERGWGYDGVGLYGVHRAYGGPEAFVRFIDAAHAVGIGVVLDVVHNHLGPEGNYLSQFGPYFTPRHHTPWGDGLNLDDEDCEEVRAFLLGAARLWLVDYRLDGLRLDAVHALVDDSPRHFLAELADAVAGWEAEAGRPLRLIAESDLNRSEMVSPTGSVPGARGMDAQWADDVHHALHSFLTGETQGYYVDFGSAEVLEKALTRVFVHDGGFSTFRGKDWGAPLDPGSDLYDGHSFVTFLQNHDQVGNRATGDRISRTVAPGAQAAGAALYLLSAFAPMVFMGEEWAASTPFPYFSHLGPELGPKVTEGRRREFADVGWADETPDPQSAETFRSAVLLWDERDEAAHARMLSWYRELIAIRHARPDVLDPSLGSTQVQVLDDDTLVMRRGQVTVAVTRASSAVEVDLGAATEVLASWDDPRELAPGRFLLPGPGALIAHRPTA
ncbi:malto-oligosyltrehalose trehalohydrolase [Tessaracoccus rhinocerotis]|uniref:Malto-oligosyltrehalose trehalohydrolase n=1 Tax=Tessaracoccus rhinocerotis TaxID=1689449 RepID=A0A553JWW7_9ACTN|nr:malto-oligosyltrehalose trehalohydrolase [Tessaracoccus rhinocerotis]TRY16936.1 malto-oligosyltrehalose trehalohydrolase [Tessaracoccus rhinocerotis]